MQQIAQALVATMALLTFMTGFRPALAADDRPNILVIISDDSGYNEFSLNGSRNFSTPHIDSIATGGVRFSEGYTSGTV